MSGLLIFTFLGLFAIALIACGAGFAYIESQRRKQVGKVVQAAAGAGTASSDAASRPALLVRGAVEEDAIGRMLERYAVRSKLKAMVSQAGLETDPNQFVIVPLALAAVGAFIGLKFNVLVYSPLSATGVAAALACLPFVYLRFKRKQRFAEVEKQFPEALDFLARSMRGGHAFSVSLEMLGAETPEPLGREFRALFNEQNLGASIEVALGNLVKRIPILDVRFFVSAVLLQRQTGGNLSEILTRLSYVIRERFTIKGQVKAASAHGKMTASILTLMPVFMTFALLFISPGYLQGMAKDPDGRKLILAAIVAQMLGFYFIRRIVNIKI